MTKEIVIIYWKDCSVQGTGTMHQDDCINLCLADLISCGILINETEEFITIGNDYYAEYKNYRDVKVYPKSGIKRIRRIKIKGA